MLLKFDARKERPSNEEWAELERYVCELYPLFLHKLNSALPGIKTENIRIAILVKLELAPTQIAFLTSKTIQAVSNARCRMFLKVHGGDKCTTEEADRWIREM